MSSAEAQLIVFRRLAKDRGNFYDFLVKRERCEKEGCLLLEVFLTPAGLAWYLPAHRLSFELAQQRGLDNRKVNEQAGLVGDGVQLLMNCKHTLDKPKQVQGLHKPAK